jgi:hypothetical protein
MNAGFTGHLNNLDYSICIEEEYGFCGIEYIPSPHEIGSFSMTNKTEIGRDNDDEDLGLNTGYILHKQCVFLMRTFILSAFPRKKFNFFYVFQSFQWG